MSFGSPGEAMHSSPRLCEARGGAKAYLHTRASFSASSPSTPLINPTIA